MKEVKSALLNELNIEKLGYDFMGYTFEEVDDLDFHHLIVPRKDCFKMGLDRGYIFWNGALLVRETAHRYLHFIEEIDRPLFCLITREMIKENMGREIKLEHLKKIREYLLYFEEVHRSEIDKKSPRVFKPTYIKNRIKL